MWILFVIIGIIVIVLIGKWLFSDNPEESQSGTNKKQEANPIKRDFKITDPTYTGIDIDGLVFSARYHSDYGLENSNINFLEHMLHFANMDVENEEDYKVIVTVQYYSQTILKYVISSGLNFDIMAAVLRSDPQVKGKLKRNVFDTDRKFPNEETTYADFLNRYSCRTYGEVAAINGICLLKLSTAGRLNHKKHENEEYNGLVHEVLSDYQSL